MMKLSFTNKIIISIITIEIMFIVLRGILHFNTLTTLADKLIQEKIDTNTKLFSNLVVTPLAVHDLATLDNQVMNFLQSKDIASVKIIDAGKRIVSRGEKDSEINFEVQSWDKENIAYVDDSVYKFVSYPIVIEKDTIGKVEVVYDLTDAYNIMKSNDDIRNILIIIEIILSAFVIYFIVSRLTKSLTQLTAKARYILPADGYVHTSAEKRSDEVQELCDAFDVMEERIQKKTDALTLAKDEAERLAKVKSEFLATMSHEIRTPMNGVLGMLQLLHNTKLEKTQKQYVDIAYASANSLLTIINDILDFSKVDAGKLDLEMIEFDLIQELKSFVESTRFKAEEKHLDLILDTSNLTKLNVVGDPGRIRQILTNLVTNAIKFTQEGKVGIYLNVDYENESQIRLHFNVIDTGIGIPKESLDSLFNLFTQVDSSTTRKYGGTGLGLAIVKKLCELMDGSISVKSELGKGSVFSFNVLLGSVNEPQPNEDIKIVERETNVLDPINITWPSNTHILVVEDNLTNQLVSKELLKILGLSCDIASHGLEAIKAMTEKNYSLVFMDCQMPVMDGYEATRNIRNGRAGEKNSHLPIIAMTANAMAGDQQLCFDAGMDDYIAKPIDVNNLKEMLVKWLLK